MSIRENRNAGEKVRMASGGIRVHGVYLFGTSPGNPTKINKNIAMKRKKKKKRRTVQTA